jgi:flagellar hook-associated protein 1
MPVNSAANHGLEIGRRALQAQQSALNVTGHNIANANTPGFSRRSANLENALSGVPGTIGAGSDLGSITRQRSRFLDAQVRVEQQVLGRWQAFERSMQGLEAIFNEPAGAGASETGTVFNESSGLGLSGSFSRFWNTWQDLANVPESGAARAAVRQEAEFMTTTLHQIHAQLRDAHAELDKGVLEQIETVNEIIDQLAVINAEIPRASFNGGTAGDLEDRRDQLLDQLSNRIDISTVEHTDGQVSVLLSGHKLVEGRTAIHLGSRRLTQDGLSSAQVIFSDDRSLAQVSEGQLRGLVIARDEVVPDLLTRMNTLASGLVEEINAVHREGFGRNGATNIDFFRADNTTAANISLDEAIAADLDNIAASQDGNSGDNGIALAIGGLRSKTVLGGGDDTFDAFYLTLLGEVGARSKEAQTMAANHSLFSTQIENRRQSVQGVSLNDEAAQLILFQRAYQAAARTVSIIDDLMEVTINL